jgi:hypothetical protein
MLSSSSALYSSRGRGRGIRAKGTVNREGFEDGVEIRSDDQGNCCLDSEGYKQEAGPVKVSVVENEQK